MIKSILLTVDGSTYSDSVLRYGVELGQAFEARLHVISIIDVRIAEWAVAVGADGFVPIIPSSVYQEESRKILEEKSEAVLKKCSEILQQENVPFEVEKLTGPPVDVICEKAHLTDLVVMGRRGEFARWETKMTGATLEAASRQCNKSILVVGRDFRKFEKILVAYDGSANSNKALQVAGFFGLKLGLPMTVLSVTEDRMLGSKICQEAERYLQSYNLNLSTEAIPGHPDKGIVEYAKQKQFDLIIMGAYGHSRIRETILGSTTAQVMRKAEMPVLLAK